MRPYNIVPVPKPRQTQRDKWLKPPRPCVARYRAFKDEVYHAKIDLLESGTKILFVLPMPKSWSKKKKKAMYYAPHKQRPDLDNLTKALFDACYQDDCIIWNITTTKVWGDIGQIWIENDIVNHNGP